MPILEKLTGEIATTGDYFEFQRLAGRGILGDQRKPYDPQVLVPGTGLPPGRVPEARIGDDLLEDLGFTTQTDRAQPAGERPAAYQPVPPPEPAPDAGDSKAVRHIKAVK